MIQPQWKFRIPQESEVNQNPIEGEFFTTNDVGGDSLVRESIQNSLDATLGNTDEENLILRVRYYFSGKSNSNNVNLDNHSLFKGIFPHMLAADNGLRNEELPKVGDKTEYLVIEDFNTTGLDGSITENDDPQKDSPLGHNFYWFWRNVGRSGKRGSERGKWGLGKTVFPASSSINTFFALTKRYDDQENYLMGLSVLKTHHLPDEPNTKRYPYGYFGNYENADKFFVTPTNDKEIIDDFERLFTLKRVEDSSSGLSVVIPFPRKEISSKSIIRSVLRQYFHPIINKKLTVEVVDQDNAIDIQITDKTIFTLLKEIEFPPEYEVSPEQLSKLFDLCAWSINQSESEMIRLNPPPLTNSIMWRRDWFVTKEVDEILKLKSNDFDEGKKVSFLIPVKLQKINSEPQICWFKLFLEKDEQLNEADSHFVRNGITITGVKKPKNRFVRALVVIEDEALVTLLGDAENPAHTEWQKESSHFRGKYEDGDKVISFVEKSIDNVCFLLSKPTEGIDRDIMKDLFFIELPEEEPNDPDEPDEPDGPEPDRPDHPVLPKKSLPFILEKHSGGFKLKKNPETNGFSGTIRVGTAYMVAKGSALKKYSAYDFDLSKSPITVSSRGVNNLEYDLNKLSFNVIHGNDFSLEISGFDEQRDLYIKANHNDSEI